MLIQSSLVISASSGLESSAVTSRGSSAIPQIGHEPGASRTIWGCIGHVYSICFAGASNFSSAMPHSGSCPEPVCFDLRMHWACIFALQRSLRLVFGTGTHSDCSAHIFLVLPGTLQRSLDCRNRKWRLDMQRSPPPSMDRPPFRRRDRALEPAALGDYGQVRSSD